VKPIHDFIAAIKVDPTAADPLVAFLKSCGRASLEVDDLIDALRREVT
jgi:hypothetical protein